MISVSKSAITLYYVVGDAQSNRFDIELGGLCDGVQLSAGKSDEPSSQVRSVVDRWPHTR